MKNYAILRTAKLTTRQSLISTLKHNYREIPTPNADPTRTPNNRHQLADSTEAAMRRFDQRLAEISANGKIRKNAVLAIEYLMTASPEWWEKSTPEQRNQWRNESLSWLARRHGTNNIIAATYQVDETTPHIAAYVVPEKDGRLNARHFLGGRAVLRAMQDDYASSMTHVGLSRGQRGSRAKHQDVKTYYRLVNQGLALGRDIEQVSKAELALIPPKKLTESHDSYAKRVYDGIIAPRLANIRERDYEIERQNKRMQHGLQMLAAKNARRDAAIKQAEAAKAAAEAEIERLRASWLENFSGQVQTKAREMNKNLISDKKRLEEQLAAAQKEYQTANNGMKYFQEIYRETQLELGKTKEALRRTEAETERQKSHNTELVATLAETRRELQTEREKSRPKPSHTLGDFGFDGR